MPLPATRKAKVVWNYGDYRLLPDDGLRYEVIDGELIVTPSPSTIHQTISKRIHLAFMLQIEQAGRGLVFYAPLDLIFSETRFVQPDLLVVAAENRHIVTERGIEGPPDLVAEILSPATERNDRQLKSKIYGAEGVKEYWIVDPTAHVVEVYVLAELGYSLHARYGIGESVASTVFDVTLEVDPIFAPVA